MTVLIRTWAIVGVIALLTSSVLRLLGPAIALQEQLLGPLHLIVLVVWSAVMVYAEAWKGFHKKFSPRVVKRAFTFPERSPWALIAPLVCMGLFHATRKRLIVSWCLVSGIVVLVMIVRQLPEPWRGIIDVGVVLGLSGGTLSVAVHGVRAALGQVPVVEPDWP